MMKRILAWSLTLALVLSLFAGWSVVFADNNYTNTGVRHSVCRALSAQAEAYYTGDYSWEKLCLLPGTKTDSSVEAAGSELFTALHQLMRSTLTTTVTYSALTGYWRYTDAAEGTSDAILFYSDVVGSGYNREHVWPKSQGNFYQDGAGSDLHHLRPTNSGVNSARSHYTMGNVRGVLDSYQTYTYSGNTVLYYDGGYAKNDDLGLVEVNDGIKGDVARILLYVYAAYGEAESGANLNLCVKTDASGAGNNANQGNKVIESLDTLLDWCELDPVDSWEMQRNDCVQNVQGNRNVFIDYPELAWLLFGRELPDMDTPSGYAHENQQGSFTVTAVSEDEAHGTVTGSGRHFTAQPAEGWYAAGWKLAPADAAVVTQSGNSFRVSELTADCTLTILFAQKTEAVLHFAVPQGVTCPDSTGYLSESVTLPMPEGTPEDPTYEYSFVGWAEAPVENETEKPAYLTEGKDFSLTQPEQTLYALYTYTVADGQGASGEYAKILQMADGDYVIGAPDKQVMMNNDYSAGTYMGFNAASFTGEIITNAKAENLFAFRTVGEYYAVYDANGFALRADGAKKVTLDPEKTEVGEADTTYLWSVVITDGQAAITPFDASQGSLQYNGSSPRFTTYKSTQVGVALYGTVSGTRYYTTVIGQSPSDPCENGHSWDAGEVLAFDCVEGGQILYTCTVCGQTKTEDLAAPGAHDFILVERLEPTVLEPGLEHYVCTRCDAYEDVALPKLDPAGYYQEVYEEREDWTGAYAIGGYELLYYAPTDTLYLTDVLLMNEKPHDMSLGGAPAVSVAEVTDLGRNVIRVPAAEENVFWFERQENGYYLIRNLKTGLYMYSMIYAVNYVKEVPDAYGWWDITVEDETLLIQNVGETREANLPVFLAYQPVSQSFGLCHRQGTTYTGTPVLLLTKDDPCIAFEDVNVFGYYHEGVDWAVTNEITLGIDASHFGPEAVCTRAQVVTFLWRANGCPKPEGAEAMPFVDVPTGSYYEQAVLWAVGAGVTTGMDATHFGPNEPCTRAQVVTFLWRALGTPEPANTADVPFTDLSEAAFYYKAVLWATEHGVTAGVSASLFAPGNSCTRAQIVTFLFRAYRGGEPAVRQTLLPRHADAAKKDA